MNLNLKSNTLLLVGISIILFEFAYFLVLNGNAFLGYSWDLYDSNVIWLDLMSKNNYFFTNSYTTIKEMMMVILLISHKMIADISFTKYWFYV